jgi:hypothetical protein
VPSEIYTPVSQLSASAGLGAFTPSFAQSWGTQVLSFLVASEVSVLFYNFQNVYPVGPVTPSCFNNGCSSYLFSSGLLFVSPRPPSTLSSEADTVVINQEECVQGDYWSGSSDEAFTTDNCHTWGSSTEAFMICIKQSNDDQNILIAGIASMSMVNYSRRRMSYDNCTQFSLLRR